MPFTGNDLWYTEACRAFEHQPHSARLMASLNTRGGGLQPFYCGGCNYVELAPSGCTPTCYGGYEWRDPAAGFASREVNLSILYNVAKWSDETGTVEQMSYHEEFLRRNGQL